jgi:hypothetical protein
VDETLIVMLIAVMLDIWSFSRNETFVADNKAATQMFILSMVNSYKKILDRPPSEAELQQQRGRLTTDVNNSPSVSRVSSSCRAQRNTVHANMEGLISDRQTIEMVKARTKINGSPPDEDAQVLVRKISSKMDDVYLEAYRKHFHGPDVTCK